MMVETPHPLWHASRAARITLTFSSSALYKTQKTRNFTYVSSAIESVVQSTVGYLDQEVLYALSFGQLRRVDEVGCAHFRCPSLFVGIRVDGDDSGCAHEGGGLDDAQTDCSATKDSHSGSLYMDRAGRKNITYIKKEDANALIPGCLTTDPQAVVIPQPNKHARFKGASLLIATTDTSATTVYCENVEVPI